MMSDQPPMEGTPPEETSSPPLSPHSSATSQHSDAESDYFTFNSDTGSKRSQHSPTASVYSTDSFLDEVFGWNPFNPGHSAPVRGMAYYPRRRAWHSTLPRPQPPRVPLYPDPMYYHPSMPSKANANVNGENRPYQGLVPISVHRRNYLRDRHTGKSFAEDGRVCYYAENPHGDSTTFGRGESFVLDNRPRDDTGRLLTVREIRAERLRTLNELDQQNQDHSNTTPPSGPLQQANMLDELDKQNQDHSSTTQPSRRSRLSQSSDVTASPSYAAIVLIALPYNYVGLQVLLQALKKGYTVRAVLKTGEEFQKLMALGSGVGDRLHKYYVEDKVSFAVVDVDSTDEATWDEALGNGVSRVVWCGEGQLPPSVIAHENEGEDNGNNNSSDGKAENTKNTKQTLAAEILRLLDAVKRHPDIKKVVIRSSVSCSLSLLHHKK
jgi:hypothetical protein